MPVFRMDYYVQGTLQEEARIEDNSKRLLEALKNMSILRNVNMTKVKSEGKTWIEYEGSIEIPQGSKAFLAILKTKDQNDPYNIFLRIDVNKEADTREKAESETRVWVEDNITGPLKRSMNITEIRIGTPMEMIKKKAGTQRSHRV
jgi:hypothetical protein